MPMRRNWMIRNVNSGEVHMKRIMSLIKAKTTKIALAASGLIVAGMSLGMSAPTSANAYYSNGNHNYSGNYTRNMMGYNNYGGYGSYNSYTSDHYNWSNNNHRTYSAYRWVYDPYLHRWVLIGYNVNHHRWELVNNYDRYNSHNNNRWDDRNGGYWYND